MLKENKDPEELAAVIMKYLNCPCKYYAPMKKDNPLISAYMEAKERGEKEGFTPIIITVDETLWECLSMNSNEGEGDFEEGNLEFDAEAVAKYRKEILNSELENGKDLLNRYREEYQEDGFDLDEEVELLDIHEYDEDFEENFNWDEADRFVGYQSYDGGKTAPVILAEIPVKNPWEIFAYLPFGGWNSCPDTMEQMAVAKYWYEQYGAVPAVITHDTLEFRLSSLVREDQAPLLALEQYSFCPDIVEQASDGFTVGMLAKILTKSYVWYFWWD